jgi:hypothetical protein
MAMDCSNQQQALPATTQHERVREFTLLLAQLAAQWHMTEGELAAAAGGACAIGRLLRRVTAEEQGIAVEDTSAELLVMLFDTRLRQRVQVGAGEEAQAVEPLVLQPPVVSYQ